MPKTQETMAKRVADLEKEVAELRALVEAAQKAAPAKAMAASAAANTAPAPVASTPAPKPAVQQVKVQEAGISPELLVVITAAVAHFLGTSAHIRSLRPLVHPSGTSPWAQQGRVFIQASHNLALSR